MPPLGSLLEPGGFEGLKLAHWPWEGSDAALGGLGERWGHASGTGHEELCHPTAGRRQANPCRGYVTHLSQNTVFYGRHPRQPHPPHPGGAPVFNECPTPRESGAEDSGQGWHTRVGVHCPHGWHCTLTRVPSPSRAPRLGRRCFVISINHGNHTPGLWGRTEVGTVPLGAVTVTKGMAHGGMALLRKRARGQTCGTEEPSPGKWPSDVPRQEGAGGDGAGRG